jgi:uncharacterized protein (DUF488 family)
MMYYRRKILLSIIKLFGGKIGKTDLQKLLLLTAISQSKASYHFLPYKFGCFSFSANADLSTLKKYEILKEDENSWELTCKKDYFAELDKHDREVLKNLKLRFEKSLGDELIKYTYRKYPYYAINSTISAKLLNKNELENIKKAKPINDETVLYTIGYEGISLEEYFNKLIKYNIEVLCDVRKNPLSMKYGFSKNQFKSVCENLGITYIHLPEVGIKSEYRRELNSQADYNSLFRIYKDKMLPEAVETQAEIAELLKKHKRIALTCFEADICQCHRLHLAEAIVKLINNKIPLKHI